MTIDIPCWKALQLRYALFDFNGTLALDGTVLESTRQRLKAVSQSFEVIIATADTFGTVAAFASSLGIAYHVIQNAGDKELIVKGLTGGVVAIGNGANDELMFSAADLAIGVLGPEGAAWSALSHADVIAPSIDWALELLTHPQRLIASLRR